MIYDEITHSIVGSLGWVDRGALWLFDLKSGKESRVVINDAQYLSLKPGRNGIFRLVHHESSIPAISIRRISKPAIELSNIFFADERWHFTGDISLWNSVDASVIVKSGDVTKLLWIDGDKEQVIDLDLNWFTNANYDLMYQTLTDSIFLPERGLIAVAIQRSSELVLFDPKQNRRVGAIMLAGRQGNPALRRWSSCRFIADDYDSLCVVDARTGVVRCSEPLQVPQPPMARQFIGGYDLGETTCAVARPFSGDVVLLDLETFAVLERAPVAGQPLAVCMTSASTFVTRDWKSGKVEVGQFG